MSSKSKLLLWARTVVWAAAGTLAVLSGVAAADAPHRKALNGSVHALLGGEGANVSWRFRCSCWSGHYQFSASIEV